MAEGFVIAAPRSGSGKTIVTLGLVAALRHRGFAVAPAKTGPDYIDAAFLARAAGRDSVNLDAWAMSPARLRTIAARHSEGADLLVAEGVMGLFDGAADGTGSTADLAQALDLPAILVVDAERQSQSIAALVHGFATWQPGLAVSGLIVNRVATTRHERMVATALAPTGIPVLGYIPHRDSLLAPDRHLGLVLPAEIASFQALLEAARTTILDYIDLAKLAALARPLSTSPLVGEVSQIGPHAHSEAGRGGRSATFPSPLAGDAARRAGEAALLPPLGQRIAIARDDAFAFLYPHWLADWRAQGAELSFFSPLADEAPATDADAVFLPGGYPELHAAGLAAASTFSAGLHAARDRGALIYGECGGYMVLGETLTDRQGITHRMTGLLPVSTAIDRPRRTLGYRRLRHKSPLPWPTHLTGHEFHYSTGLARGQGTPLFAATDAIGDAQPPMGQVLGRVMGSYAHVIDIA